MKGVIDDIVVKAVSGTDEWILMEDFEWFGFIVPAGFVTDFASIPRPVKMFINPVGKIKPAAIVHDRLYKLRGKLDNPILFRSEHRIDLTRKQCDQMFLDIMEWIGMSWIERHTAYRGVRTGGWIFWNKPEEDQNDGK